MTMHDSILSGEAWFQLLHIHLNFTITWACQSLHSWNLFTTCKCMQISKIQSTYTARKFSFNLKTVISFDQLPEIQENRNESLTMPQWSCSYLEISQNLHFTTCKLLSSSSPHNCLLVVVCCLVRHSIRLVSSWRVQITFLEAGPGCWCSGLWVARRGTWAWGHLISHGIQWQWCKEKRKVKEWDRNGM